MPYKLTIPKGQIVPDTACFYRIHLGHRKNAAHLAANLIRKAAEIEKSEPCDDPLLKQFENIVERWALYTIFQGLYIREYHEWERAVKNYIYDQRIWNGISGDFDWKSGRKSFVKRTIEALTFLSASVDQTILNDIDNVRNKVNNIKHDPFAHDVDESDYTSAIKVFEAFWEKLMELEDTSIAPAATFATPAMPDTSDGFAQYDELVERANSLATGGDLDAFAAFLRGEK